MHLQHNSLTFLLLALRFMTYFRLGHAQKSKFLNEKVAYVFRLFDFWNFFSPFLFVLFCSFLLPAVIDLLLGLLAVKKLLRKHHRDGQFLPWSSQV